MEQASKYIIRAIVTPLRAGSMKRYSLLTTNYSLLTTRNSVLTEGLLRELSNALNKVLIRSSVRRDELADLRYKRKRVPASAASHATAKGSRTMQKVTPQHRDHGACGEMKPCDCASMHDHAHSSMHGHVHSSMHGHAHSSMRGHVHSSMHGHVNSS